MEKKKKLIRKYSSNLACAYPFLYEHVAIVDHEIMTDEIATHIGVLYALVDDKPLKEDLEWLCEWSWHLGGSVRGKNCIDQAFIDKLLNMYQKYDGKLTNFDRKRFTLPIGSLPASYCEIIRNRFKKAVRNLFLVEKQMYENDMPITIDQKIYDALNICSNLFYLLSLYIRVINQEEVKTYTSKSFFDNKKIVF